VVRVIRFIWVNVAGFKFGQCGENTNLLRKKRKKKKKNNPHEKLSFCVKVITPYPNTIMYNQTHGRFDILKVP